jgi:hypothetical protein
MNETSKMENEIMQAMCKQAQSAEVVLCSVCHWFYFTTAATNLLLAG